LGKNNFHGLSLFLFEGFPWNSAPGNVLALATEGVWLWQADNDGLFTLV